LVGALGHRDKAKERVRIFIGLGAYCTFWTECTKNTRIHGTLPAKFLIVALFFKCDKVQNHGITPFVSFWENIRKALVWTGSRRCPPNSPCPVPACRSTALWSSS